jgi:hypothetical protein
VKHRLPPWFVLVSVAVLCAVAIACVALIRMRASSPAGLLSRMPQDGVIVVSIDFRALRKAGLLAILGGPKMSQEPEYRSFVDETGFDYLNDLDTALISFGPTGTYFLLRGRFDWKALKAYVAHRGGDCHNAFCRVEGSTPQRMISFFPVYGNVMGLAVSGNPYAASALQTRRRLDLAVPSEPLWALVRVRKLADRSDLPPAAQVFVQALGGAQTVLLAARPTGTRFMAGFDASCASPAAAGALATRLRDITAHLRDTLSAPDPRELSGVLAAGVFEQKGSHVLGRWPVQRAFLQSLSEGAL